MNFYEQFVEFDASKSSDTQEYAICPFHNDTNASLTINKDTDAWYCHGCGVGGHHVEFIMKYFDVTRSRAVEAHHMWQKKGTWIFPSEAYVEKCAESLKRHPSILDELHSFGITDEIIAKYQLGWEDIRVTIPIRSKTGAVINVRKYLPPSKRIVGSNNAKIIGVKGLNDCRIFPYDVIFDTPKDEPIYIVEGEKDCLVALSHGLATITGTGGTTLPLDEMYLLADRKVFVMTDVDPAGEKNAKKYIAALSQHTKNIAQIRLPEKDFTDFWVKYQSTELSAWTINNVAGHDTEGTAIVGSTTLVKSEYVENLNNWIQLNNMCITGADPKTYTIPNKLRLTCKNKHCDNMCPIGMSRDPIKLNVEPRQMVLFVESPDSTQDTYLQKLFGCKHIVAEPESYVNVQKILFQESAAFIGGLEDASFEHRYGLFLYDEVRLLPTVKYDFEACRVSDPRSQQNYYVIRRASTPQASIAGLAIPNDSILFFKSIAARHPNGTIWDILDEHYEMWRARLGIEGRLDLFGALLLTYLSVTEIKWKSGIIKGWLDTMVIGDTRTGKSQMAQRFVQLLGMGSYINGENAKRTGVIGGVQRFGDSWVITWGAIPLNDKGLLLVDEASGLSIEDIKELSATRSSGAVTINKIAKGEARARTRIIWLTNPRSGRNLDEFYWKGYGAFQEFIPVAEDQARYDVLVAAARDDVDVGSYADTEEPINMEDIISKMIDLISFAWSLPVSDIIMENDTIKAVKEAAKRLDEDLGGGPLVVGVAVHEKILRIACACAMLRGNIDSRCLQVTPQEVADAEAFLRVTFEKPSLDYTGYIKESKRVQRERVANVNFIKVKVSTYPALRILLSSNQFRGGQMQEILGIDRSEASALLSELLRRGLVKLSNSGAYSPDKMLIEITKQIGGD